MNAANLLRGLVILSHLLVGERLATAQDSTHRIARTPPVNDAQQVELRLCAVEMSGQTLRQLGLGTNDKNNRLGVSTTESPLLTSAAAWEAALETAARLGAVRVTSSPTIVTVSGRTAEMECLGIDFNDRNAKKAGPANVCVKWAVTPTITKSGEASVDVRYRLSKSHPLEAPAPSGVRPSDHALEVKTQVTIPFDKPHVLGGVCVESVPQGSKKAESTQETATLIVLTANRVDEQVASNKKHAQK